MKAPATNATALTGIAQRPRENGAGVRGQPRKRAYSNIPSTMVYTNHIAAVAAVIRTEICWEKMKGSPVRTATVMMAT